MTIASRRPSQPLTAASINKRPRSPDADETIHPTNTKRSRPGVSHMTTVTSNKTATMPIATDARELREGHDRLRQREERRQAKMEFLSKYTKAFPSFVFYFDERDDGRQQAESRVLSLGASIEHFFSASVTHVITNRSQPPKDEQYDPSNKENVATRAPSLRGNVLKSPNQLQGRHDHGEYDKLVRDAVQLGKKIWSISKLDNVLSRLIPSASAASKSKTDQQSPPLTQLLQHERLHGTTSERDPRERRHDYQYFSKGSYFLLVEDIRGELAPIAIMEYPAQMRSAEKDKLPTYPLLYMDPRARSPFVKFDAKEARKLEKIEANEKLKSLEREKHRGKVRELLKWHHEETQIRTRTLRRCASMSQLERREICANFQSVGPETSGGSTGLTILNLGPIGEHTGYQQTASGFGPSTTGLGVGNGYLAASCNSVAITSTNTTSFARPLGSNHLPSNLRERLGRQVVTSRRLDGANGATCANGKDNPAAFETRLRKAKSTTTMKLPAREESKKPGYCEACRIKFEDFTQHIRGSRHRKFAQNENNYIDLDFLLRRLQRKLKVEGSSTRIARGSDIKFGDDPPSDACLGPGDYFYLSPSPQLQAEVAIESDWGHVDNTNVPRIVVGRDES